MVGQKIKGLLDVTSYYVTFNAMNMVMMMSRLKG